MTDNLKRLSRAELRRLKPGDWVAWGKSNWDAPDKPDAAFWEAEIIAPFTRSDHTVTVLFDGVACTLYKSQLFKVQSVMAIEDMHTEYDYNS
jgi:hypothetical protein